MRNTWPRALLDSASARYSRNCMATTMVRIATLARAWGCSKGEEGTKRKTPTELSVAKATNNTATQHKTTSAQEP